MKWQVAQVGLRIAEKAEDGAGGGYWQHMKNLKWEFAVIRCRFERCPRLLLHAHCSLSALQCSALHEGGRERLNKHRQKSCPVAPSCCPSSSGETGWTGAFSAASGVETRTHDIATHPQQPL